MEQAVSVGARLAGAMVRLFEQAGKASGERRGGGGGAWAAVCSLGRSLRVHALGVEGL